MIHSGLNLMRMPPLLASNAYVGIRQTVVGDCSFVCALAISADYERRFKKPIITNRMFPRRNGQPCVNPCGKYMIKLHFNGSWRKVVIGESGPEVGAGSGVNGD